MLIPAKQFPIKAIALRNRSAFSPIPTIALTILLSGLVSQGSAQVYDWSNIGASGSADPYFNVGANWNGGIAPGATDTARFNANRLYQVWWNPAVSSQLPEVGVLTVTNGQIGFVNQDNRNQSLLTVNGVGSTADFNVSGAGTELTILGHHVRSLGGGQVLDGAELTIDGSHATGSQLSIEGGAGFDIAGSLSVASGGIVSSSGAAIGRWSGDSGDVTLTDQSEWNAGDSLLVGAAGNGKLFIESGSRVTSGGSQIGTSSTSNQSLVSVSGSDSVWDTGNMAVGEQGDGQLTISNGGYVSNLRGIIGRGSASTGTVIVTGLNSEWHNETFLDLAGTTFVGEGGTGRLDILDKGKVTAGATVLWADSTLLINGGTLETRGFYNVRGGEFLFVDGSLKVTGGGLFGGFNPGTTSFTINGGTKDFSPTLTIDDQATASLPDGLTIGDNHEGHLIVSNGGHVDNGPGIVAKQASSVGSATVTGAGSQWDNVKLYVGGSNSSGGGLGSVSITDEGHVEVAATTKIWSTGTVTIDGGSLKTHTLNNSAGGILNLNDGKLTVDGGSFDPGIADFKINGSNASAEPILELANGATANLMGLFSVAETSNGTLLMSGGSNLFAERAEIGTVDTAVGQVTVSGSSTLLETEFDITVGGAGSGELNVVDGGVVSSGYGKIGLLSTNGHSGRILVANAGSTLNLTNALSVGPMGVGSLEVRDGGVVTSNGGGIGLGSNNGIGTVTLSDAGSRWNNSGALLVGGSGQGELLVKSGAVVISDSGQISMAATAPFGSGLVTVTGNGSTWTNQSNLFVGGNEFESKGVGTLEISDGGYVSSKTNATIWETGIVTINGGQLDVGATLTNAGRIFVTELGADIFGNVDIVANGKIETLTGSTAVLHGNVTHNGSQVRTAASSTTQFSGMVTGAGRYLGDGLVKFDDVFRPGNSTSEIEFAGDVEFGANSLSYFELGGLNPGEFDSLDIAGDLSLAGELSVSLWDQFQLESGQEFLIADVNGSLIGQYEGLGEGDWVGQFGGVDLFISYRAGNGNDVGLFSSVPEPGSLAFGILAIMGMAMKRRRRLG